MRYLYVAAALALLAAARPLSAQQPEARRPEAAPPGRGMMGAQHMRMMDSADARLDTLVTRMNRATGNAKVAAMADVINELVAQRKAMRQHMRGMMMMPEADSPGATPQPDDSAQHRHERPPG